MAKSLWLFLFFLSCHFHSNGQQFRFNPINPITKAEIPFQFINNYIIVEVLFNNRLPLKFILDTGSEHTIITRKEITDALQVPYKRRIKIIGADLQNELYVLLVPGVSLQMKEIIIPHHSVLVLEDNFLRFEEIVGTPVHGILGIDIFKQYILKINYERRMLTVYHPDSFKKPGKGFQKYPLEIYKNKPYLNNVNVLLQNGKELDVKLLLDTGAALSLLLYTNSHPFLQLPDHYIRGNLGRGIGGYLEGFLGRIKQFEISPFSIDYLLTNFQEIELDSTMTFINQRNGILGNLILSRFEVILDFYNKQLYLKAKRGYNKGFKYDKSGIILIAAGEKLNSYIVQFVIEGSPADEAGILAGDQIKSINGIGASFISLNGLSNKFTKKEGKKIRLTVMREGKKIKTTFSLRKLI